MKRILICISVVVFLLTGCTSNPLNMPTTKNSKYMLINSAASADPNTGKVYFSVIIHFHPQTPDNIAVKAIFRKASDKFNPFIVSNSFNRVPKTIVLKTSTVYSLKPNQNCYVDVLLYNKEDLSTPIDEVKDYYFHTGIIGSDIFGNRIVDLK